MQIDQALFYELLRFHCMGVYDDHEMNQRIKEQLEQKLNKMCAREKYKQQLKENGKVPE